MGLSSEIYLDESGINRYRPLLKGEAPRFSADFSHHLSCERPFHCQNHIMQHLGYVKGIVQRDVRGVESRLKRSTLINHLVALVHFFNLKGHSC
jgi:hypothetical protein